MVAVIALLAVLTVFGASVVVISTTQHVGAALDFQGVRAYYAARGGLEWAAYRVLRDGQPCAAIDGQTLTYGANLSGLSVTIGCLSSTHEEGSTPITLFAITATGCTESTCAASPTPPPSTYVERQLRLTLWKN
jgi:MSHA biogenesis protein MshP